AGQPAVVAGQPAVVAGQPAVVAGQPAVVAGEPAAVAGQPAAVAGQPAITAGQPAVTAEQPATAAGRPAPPAYRPAAAACRQADTPGPRTTEKPGANLGDVVLVGAPTRPAVDGVGPQPGVVDAWVGGFSVRQELSDRSDSGRPQQPAVQPFQV